MTNATSGVACGRATSIVVLIEHFMQQHDKLCSMSAKGHLHGDALTCILTSSQAQGNEHDGSLTELDTETAYSICVCSSRTGQQTGMSNPTYADACLQAMYCPIIQIAIHVFAVLTRLMSNHAL